MFLANGETRDVVWALRCINVRTDLSFDSVLLNLLRFYCCDEVLEYILWDRVAATGVLAVKQSLPKGEVIFVHSVNDGQHSDSINDDSCFQ